MDSRHDVHRVWARCCKRALCSRRRGHATVLGFLRHWGVLIFVDSVWQHRAAHFVGRWRRRVVANFNGTSSKCCSSLVQHKCNHQGRLRESRRRTAGAYLIVQHFRHNNVLVTCCYDFMAHSSLHGPSQRRGKCWRLCQDSVRPRSFCFQQRSPLLESALRTELWFVCRVPFHCRCIEIGAQHLCPASAWVSAGVPLGMWHYPSSRRGAGAQDLLR